VNQKLKNFLAYLNFFSYNQKAYPKTVWINMLDTELLDLAISVKYFD